MSYTVEQVNSMKRKEMSTILINNLGICEFQKRFNQLCDWHTQTGALRYMMIETFKIYN